MSRKRVFGVATRESANDLLTTFDGATVECYKAETSTAIDLYEEENSATPATITTDDEGNYEFWIDYKYENSPIKLVFSKAEYPDQVVDNIFIGATLHDHSLEVSSELYVDGNRTDNYDEDGSKVFPYKTLSDAYDNANDNTLIFLLAGNYNETINISKNIYIQGVGKDSSIIGNRVTLSSGTFIINEIELEQGIEITGGTFYSNFCKISRGSGSATVYMSDGYAWISNTNMQPAGSIRVIQQDGGQIHLFNCDMQGSLATTPLIESNDNIGDSVIKINNSLVYNTGGGNSITVSNSGLSGLLNSFNGLEVTGDIVTGSSPASITNTVMISGNISGSNLTFIPVSQLENDANYQNAAQVDSDISTHAGNSYVHHPHDNKSELDQITDGDHDVRVDNPHNVLPAQQDYTNTTYPEISNEEEFLDNIGKYSNELGGTGRITPEEPLTQTGLNSIQVNAGRGYISYISLVKEVSWDTSSIDTTGYAEGYYWVYVDESSVLHTESTPPDKYTNVVLGSFYYGGTLIAAVIQDNTIFSNAELRSALVFERLGAFISDAGGELNLMSNPIRVVSSPLKYQHGYFSKDLGEITSDDAGDTFTVAYYSNDAEWERDFWFQSSVGLDGDIPTEYWNDRTKNSDGTASADCTFTNGSSTVTSAIDLTSEIVDGDFIYLASDGRVYMSRVQSVSWDGSQTTITLEANYQGAGGTGSTVVNKALPQIPAGKFVKHGVGRSPDGTMVLMLGNSVCDTEEEAFQASIPSMPEYLEVSVVKIASIVVEQGTTDLTGKITDIRPLPFFEMVGGKKGGEVINEHGLLLGLGDDDHHQYLLTNGNRNLTGVQSYDSNKTFSLDTDIPSKKYVDDGLADQDEASELSTDVSNFDDRLSSNDDDIQKALDTLDDHTHPHSDITERDVAGAHPASAITADTTNFDDQLSVSEDTLQKIVDKLDDVVFGMFYKQAESTAESSTTNAPASKVQKVRLTTDTLKAGDYRIGWFYQFSTDDESKAMWFEVELNDTTQLDVHTPIQNKNLADGVYNEVEGFVKVSLSEGTHDIDLNFANDGEKTTYIKNARLEIWRVS